MCGDPSMHEQRCNKRHSGSHTLSALVKAGEELMGKGIQLQPECYLVLWQKRAAELQIACEKSMDGFLNSCKHVLQSRLHRMMWRVACDRFVYV